MTDRMRPAMDERRERLEAARRRAGERVDAVRDAAGGRVDAVRDAAGGRVEAAREAAGERLESARAAAGERVDAARAAAGEIQAKVKPRLRGVIHTWSFPVSIVAGGALVIAASGGRERLALAIYAISLSALLGTSALYHRVDWRRAAARRWVRRLDHSMIFLLIAGTVTPFALLVLEGPLATALLIAIWAGAAAGIVVEAIWIEAPKWVSALVYIVVGWIGALAFPMIVAEAGIIAGLLIAAGGFLYTAGAVVYARQRPDPKPEVFGYHEIFHVLVVAAALVHFTAVAVYAGPIG